MPTPLKQNLQIALQHHQAGRLREAEGLYRAVLAVDANQPDALHLLGVLAHQAGQHELAIRLIGQSIAVRPEHGESHHHLGTVYLVTGRYDEAIASLSRAHQLRPREAQTLVYLGHALREKGRVQEAIEAYALAGKLGAAVEELLIYATDLHEAGKVTAAIFGFERALELRPEYPEAWLNFGNALRDARQWDRAIAAYERALALRRDYAAAHNNLGSLKKDCAEITEAISHFQQALTGSQPATAVTNDRAIAHSNLLLAMHYDPATTAEALLQEARQWDEIHAAPLRATHRPFTNDRDPNRRLRVGYVSADFYTHSFASFLQPLLANHNRRDFEIFCYAGNRFQDTMTETLKAAADHWVPTASITDADLAKRIRADGIDILVDLMGHTANHRLLAFARKPAPVQISYLGYPGTTGLEGMDYRFTDAFADPVGGTDRWYTEKLIRLPGTFLCYAPPAGAPAVNALPAAAAGRITFGSFSNVAKISAAAIALWSSVLRQLSTARLLLKWTHLAHGPTRQRLLAAFAAEGVGDERLDLLPESHTLEEHLAAYHQVDIALDTFPYHGTTTTCDALWMGVPVISLMGAMHVSRVGLSVLSNVASNLAHLATDSPEAFVTQALKLANDLPTLTALRANLRPAMQSAVLTDGPRLTNHIEAHYRQLWQKWCTHPVE